MQAWGTSLTFAVLVVTIPFTLYTRMLYQIPRALALSHRRWALPLNYTLIAAVTSYTTYFIHRGYYGERLSAGQLAGGCLIAAAVFGFALALLNGQFCGVYAEFVITTGKAGFGLRKTRYRNIQDVEIVAERPGETELLIETVRGLALTFTLPNRYVSIFFEQVKKKLQDG